MPYLKSDLEKVISSRTRFKGPDECWDWLGDLDKTGRARVGLNRVTTHASHIILELQGKPRPAPPNDNALHNPMCSPDCCNPKHLRWGSQQENMRDRTFANILRSDWRIKDAPPQEN